MRAKLWTAALALCIAHALGCAREPAWAGPPSSEAWDGGALDAAPLPLPVSAEDAATAALPFDRGGSGAMPHVDVQMCKRTEGPAGSGHATMRFAPDGTVTDVKLDAGPFAGTAEAGCIEDRFRSLRIPPFAGEPVTAGKSFTIN